MNKTNFLGIYGRAHQRALTPENIKSSFRKTGVWPFDPSVITPEMMAPSKETSCEGHLPITPVTPVRVIAKLLRDLAVKDDIPEEDEDEEGEEGGSEVINESDASSGRKGDDGNHADNVGETHADGGSTNLLKERKIVSRPVTIINAAIKQLSEGSLASLVSSVPMTSSTIVDHNVNQLISPSRSRTSDALQINPKTMTEIILLGALRESEEREASLKRRVLELQAANILNEAYCSRLRGQLAHKEDKKANPKGKGKLMGDGLPCLLSGDWFYERVVEAEAWQRREEQEKAARLESRDERSKALERWKEKQEERKAVIAARRVEWEEEKKVWADEKAAAKLAKTRFEKKKPVLGKLPASIPRPKVTSVVEEDGEEDEDNPGDDDDDDSENEP